MRCRAAYLAVVTGAHAALQMESAREAALSCCLLQHMRRSAHMLFVQAPPARTTSIPEAKASLPGLSEALKFLKA